MGLCKCAKRKVTNLFCFEHDVNVCEFCLVADHERCIVQSYVQWLQDSDYKPICILCNNLLKEEETVRLICYDIFHLHCLDKFASQLPGNTAPAGYQCPKCKECIFPPDNLVSPIVDVLRQKLQNFNWSRIGLGQSLLPLDESSSLNELTNTNQSDNLANQIMTVSNTTSLASNGEDETNGFVIVNDQVQTRKEIPIANDLEDHNQIQINESTATGEVEKKPENFQNIQQSLPNINSMTQNAQKAQVNLNLDQIYSENAQQSISHNRAPTHSTQKYEEEQTSYYDSSLGMVLNMEDNDRDTGEYKYQRRPLFEWLNRWLKSRQLLNKVRMTRQKKYLFMVIILFISLFTLIIIFSQLGSMSTEDDPAFDPMNNPNIHVQ